MAFEIYILWPPSWFQLCNVSMAMFPHRNSNKKNAVMAEWNKQEVPGELTDENNLYNFRFLEDGAH